MVEDRSLCGSSRPSIMVRSDGVQELGQHVARKTLGTLLDHSKAQVDVAEERALACRRKKRPGIELARAPDVVQQRCREHEIRSQASVECRRLPAEGCDCDGVLEEAARIRVMAVERRRQPAEAFPQGVVLHESCDRRVQARVGELIREEVEEPVKLGDVSHGRWNKGCRIGVGRRFDRSQVKLQSRVEALNPAKNPDSVPFRETLVEHLDVAPDARVDSSARVDELESEVRRTRAGRASILSRDRVHAVDEPVGLEVSDGRRGAHDRRV